MRYGQKGNDFWAGPVSNEDSDAGTYYDKFFRVTKKEIDNHIAGIFTSENILNWPAHGRTEYGESANLAPYVSVSGNSTYTPSQGDYPLIRGEEAIFWISNDKCGSHTESGGKPLGVEILSMAYAYNSPDYELQHTIFLSYQIRNKSTNHYKDFYVGLFADFDIGYSRDDYIGCDSALNLSYGYNGLKIDGMGEMWAYGEHPPAQGAMFLNQKMSGFIYFNNLGSNLMTDPNNAKEYYNNLQAKWKDETPLTFGGNGYNPTSTNYTNFAFSGDPVSQTGWTEILPDGEGSVPNIPHDRRGIMSTGSFILPAGESICIDIALPFAQDSVGDNLSSVALLKQNAQAIQQFYDNQNYVMTCAEIFQPEFCEMPTELLGVAEENNAVITWNEPENMDGILIGYNVYRDGYKVSTTASDEREYIDYYLYNGTYFYQVSASYLHCKESDLTENVCVEINFDAIPEFLEANIHIYPNPTTGELRIELRQAQLPNGELKINNVVFFDVFGRKVLEPTLTVSHSYDLTVLKPGIYFVKIETDLGVVFKKVIKL